MNMGLVGFVTAVVLLLGTDLTSAQDASACISKVQECSQISTTLSSAFSSSPDVEALCSSAIQNLTQCVASADTPCSGQEQFLAGLQNQLTSLKNTTCSTQTLCSTKASKCSMLMASQPESGSSSSSPPMLRTCQLFPQVLTCLNNLGPECQGTQVVRQLNSSIGAGVTACGYFTDGGACMDAINCFVSLLNPNASLPNCRTIAEMLACLKQKSQAADCTLDESKISFTKVSDLMADMCPNTNQNCSAAYECIIPEGFKMAMNIGNESMTGMPSVAANFTDPVFYCSMMTKAAMCYAGKEQACGFPKAYTDRMRAKHEDLKKQCSTGGAAVMVPEMLCFVMAALAMLVSLWSHP